MTSLQEGLNGLRKRRLIDIPSIKIHFSSHGYVSRDVYLVRVTFFCSTLRLQLRTCNGFYFINKNHQAPR